MLAWLQAAPKDAAEWKSIGMRAASTGEMEAAAKYFDKGCELDPSDDDACYYLGRTLYTLARYAEARRAFEVALKTAPNRRERAARAAALNAVALDQPAEAERHFRDAVRAHSDSDRSVEDTRIEFGAFLVRQGRAGEAVPLLAEALKGSPGSARGNTELGRALLHLGRSSEAARCLETAVKADPSSVATRLLLGRAYLHLGRAADAERELRIGREGWVHGSSTAR